MALQVRVAGSSAAEKVASSDPTVLRFQGRLRFPSSTAARLRRVRSVRVAVPKEAGAGERRVALVPDSVGRPRLQASPSPSSGRPGGGRLETEYADAGAEVVARASCSGAQAVVRVAARPRTRSPSSHREPSSSASSPLTDTAGIARLAERGVVAFAMESIPRITRAQSMDALSSQSTVAGYKAVVAAADRCPASSRR